MRVELPAAFLERIQKQLQEETPEFLASYEKPENRGIRINRLKTTTEEIKRQAPFYMEPVPWVPDAFFIKPEADPAGHPFYRAGLYYIQEPSAMTPASRLPVEPGEKVLDLCAAPGGKATALASKLQGRGLLVANDISASRCRPLQHNLELFGAGNIIVTNELPGRLEEHFPAYFDKILVDAPCSGEGMFRRDPEVIKTWSPERVEYFAAQQRSILKSAAAMLRPGGMLLYSTCTFSELENEGSISFLLEYFPEMEPVEIAPYEGFAPGVPAWGNGDPRLAKTVRIWPHKMDGAGHFLALLRKNGIPEAGEDAAGKKKKKQRRGGQPSGGFSSEERAVMKTFLEEYAFDIRPEELENRGGKVYWMPFDKSKVAGLKILRAGLFMGELKTKRFEPSQSLALWQGSRSCTKTLELPLSDPRLSRFLQGEHLTLTPEESKGGNGLVLVQTEGFSLGFGKKVNGVLKNKYVWLH